MWKPKAVMKWSEPQCPNNWGFVTSRLLEEVQTSIGMIPPPNWIVRLAASVTNTKISYQPYGLTVTTPPSFIEIYLRST